MTKLNDEHLNAHAKIKHLFEVERSLIEDARADFELAKTQARTPTNDAIRDARALVPSLPKGLIREILGNKNYDNLEKRIIESKERGL